MLSQGMGQGLHWFPEDVPASRLAVTLAGMANAGGGTVLLGVAPRSEKVHGISDPAGALDRVFQAALLLDPPLVLPAPRFADIQQMQVLVTQVPAGLPYVYNLDGRYWIREGAQTNLLSARLLRRLLIERGVVQFESRLPPEAAWEDLDIDQAAAYAQAFDFSGEKKLEDVLLQRGCVQRVEGQLRPTYAGLLLFGRYPQRWLPSASILAARFSGASFTDQEASDAHGEGGLHYVKKELNGSLPEQLRQAEAFLWLSLRSVVRIVGLAHQETLEYPFEAVRELLVNAVAHRDYNLQGDTIHLHLFSDHLEVRSPGGLPGPVTLDNLLEARFSRNPVITQVLSDLGFVERLGYGLDRVMVVLREQNLRPPRFEEVAGSFRVTLYNDLPGAASAEMAEQLAAYQHLDLNTRQQIVLNFLARNRKVTSREYQELCPDVHAETLRRDLAEMVSRGLLLKIGDKRATYYVLKKLSKREKP